MRGKLVVTPAVLACVTRLAAAEEAVKVGDLGIVDDGTMSIGIEKGYFKERGITVKLEKFPSAATAIVCGRTVGRLASIGAGAVVTKDVPGYALMLGAPARIAGWMCECGVRFHTDSGGGACSDCGRRYATDGERVQAVEGATTR